MRARRLLGTVAAFGLVGAGSGGLAVAGVAAPADAFTGTCPTTTPTAVLVADGVCEVRITTAGASTFTPPSGITKLAAVLVGAGSGGYASGDSFAYAGNGGAVVYVDSVPLTGPVSVTVGAGSGTTTVGDTPAAGGDTTIAVGASTSTASGGAAADIDNDYCFQGENAVHSGDGDGGANANSGYPNCLPGAGVGLADLTGTDPVLFPAAANGTDSYGAGGTGSVLQPIEVGVAGSGGSATSGTSLVEPPAVPPAPVPAVAVAGANGLVIFRFAAVVPTATPTPTPSVSPALAATGTSVSWEVPAISAGMIGVGALLFVLFRRRRPGTTSQR